MKAQKSIRQKILYASLILLCIGCAIASSKGYIGQTSYRKLAILGEYIDQNLIAYYRNKYDALVWFTPSKGEITDTVKKTLFMSIGPSGSMKGLINELKSMNESSGTWQIIIPRIAEKYILHTLKYMNDGAIDEAKGTFYLVESSGDKQIETEVLRVSDGTFNVKYEFK